MPRPLRLEYPGARYHVTTRGNACQRIFHGEDYYARFLQQLRYCVETDEVILYAVALMPNHVHLLIETPRGNLSKFMQRLGTAYAMYYRYKHQSPGHCLQGRFHAKLIGEDSYLLRVSRYIHLNPVRVASIAKPSMARQREALDAFQWSSYRGYVRKEHALDWVDYGVLAVQGCRTMRGSRQAYRAYVERMLGREDEELGRAMAASRYAVGSDEYVAEVDAEVKRLRVGMDHQTDTLGPREETVESGRVDQVVADHYGVEVDDLHRKWARVSMARAVGIELCCRLAGLSQRAVAGHYGLSDNAVSYWRRVRRECRHEDDELAAELAALTHQLRGPIGKNL